MIRRFSAAAIAAAFLFVAAPAMGAPVATSDGAYQALGRVFPDPQAGCQQAGAGGAPCSPNAQGNLPATSFIGIDEFVDALRYMNGRADWRRYMDVWALDGKVGDGSSDGSSPGAVFPGDNVPLEFHPSSKFDSAGIPTTGLDRQKSDLIVVRVTDESVPDRGKKRYALSLSIHGIERAGAEGGTRAMEDLVTAATSGKANKPIVSNAVQSGAPTFGDVLRKSIIYFTYPNPDGWRRGSVSSGPNGGVFFQRYNGNGVDPNRDWPDIGYSFRPYSSISEPETQAWISFYGDVRSMGGPFSAGDDLHGQPFADALSFTLLPHGRHNYEKNARIQSAAEAINRSTYDSIKWSPIVQSNDKPHGGGAPCSPDVLGTACAKIYAQTWGSVYDTINYTTTGALGDWFDSSIGLGADGIDNEMSFSHLDKNINFEPQTEQLHVDGNKALIYAHLGQILDPSYDPFFEAHGRKAYVPNTRVAAGDRQNLRGAPPGTQPQSDLDSGPQPAPGGGEYDFKVLSGPQAGGSDAGKNVFNGGMRVEVTDSNVQGIGSGQVGLQVQCRNCDEHPGVKEDSSDWVTVAEDYNQSLVYAQSGVVATVNEPQSVGRNGQPVEWRALVSGPTAAMRVQVHFSSGFASSSGDTGGGPPPTSKGYNVANTDFFADLGRFIPFKEEDPQALDPRRVIQGKQSLDVFDTIALADDPLPGYTGPIGGVSERPTGPATKDFEFDSDPSFPGAGQGLPGTYAEKEFTVGQNDGDKSIEVKISWTNDQSDYDLHVYRLDSAGNRSEVGNSVSSPPGTSETATITDPKPGKYVIHADNYASPEPTFHGKVHFEPLPASDTARGTGDYTIAEKDKWFSKLAAWVRGGGNLVLTDGALRALPEMVGIASTAISPQTVYAGQSAFAKDDSGSNTLRDPLARDVAAPGARFNTGMRRQMYEPTPLGFAIQNKQGADASFARQYDVDRAAWEKAGGRTTATSADSGARDAKAVYSRTTIGQLGLGKGDIRIAGALLPRPTEDYDHEFGLEPYAVTASGYVIARNLLDTVNRLHPGSELGGRGNIGGRFRISRRAVKLRRGVARVRVSCRTPLGCKGTLKLQVRKGAVTKAEAGTAAKKKKRKRAKLVTIGQARFNYPSKKRNAVLKVKLNKRGLKLARRSGRRIRIHAAAPLKFRDGRKGTSRRAFWLYRTSPSRRR